MSDSPLTWADIIDTLGGTGAVARSLKLASPTVSGWRTRGIPSMYWLDLVGLAAASGKSDIVSLEALAVLAAEAKNAVLEARA